MFSIRQEVARLLIVATVPLLVVLGLSIYAEYRTAFRSAESRTARVAELTALSTSDLLRDARRNLEHLAGDPLVAAMDPASCSPAMAYARAVDARFISVVSADLEGYLVCSTSKLPADRRLRVVDPALHREVVEGGGFGISRPFKGVITGRWTLSLAAPVRRDGQIVGAVAIGLDLTGWRFLALTPSLPSDIVISILAGDGTIIARSLEAEKRVGQNTADNEAGRTALRIRDGTASGVNENGEHRIYAFKPVPGTDWIAAAGSSLSVVRANSEKVLVQSVALALLAILLSSYLARLLARRIIDPISAMAMSARAQAEGRNAIVAVPAGPAEIVGLAEAMNLSSEHRATAERALRRAQQMASLSLVITGPHGEFISWADTLPGMIGVAASEMPRSTRAWLELVHPDDREAFRNGAIVAAATGRRMEVDYRLRRGDGTWIHIRQVSEPLVLVRDTTGPRRWFGTLQDVSDQKKSEEGIRRLNRVYAVLSGINALIVRVRKVDELYAEACRVAVEAGGFRSAWVGVVDRATRKVVPVAWYGRGAIGEPIPIDEEEASGTALGIAAQAIRDGRAVTVSDTRTDGRPLLKAQAVDQGFGSLAVFPLLVGDHPAGVLALYAAEPGFFDNAEEMKLLHELAGDIVFALDHLNKEAQLGYFAYYDSITGLANRTLFYERFEQGIGAATRDGYKLALVLLDIERFKSIGNSLGRQGADQLLKQVAHRIRDSNPDVSAFARLEAGLFAILAPGVIALDALALSAEQRLHHLFDKPFRVADTELRIAAKCGIAVFPDDGRDVDTLVVNAEAALRRAESSSETVMFYAQSMNERVSETLALESKLRLALERREFVLHYQPKVDAATGRIVGLEALIRWLSPELGVVPPMRFIPLLEETGLILAVGSWILQRAATDYRNLAGRIPRPPPIAVNVSPIQLRHRDFVSVVGRAIGGATEPVAKIDLEITETVIMDDVEGNIERLRAVRNLDVNIAIDDFGTGYSSLAYLARLPVTTLKIDRTFVSAMIDQPGAMTLVQTMISLAHSLQLKVVAEGVENEDQAKALRALRCDEMQGYLFGKPMPFGELVTLLAERA
jgi:diguanylate cyclase (GGDEF)-like protein/PAS domain S-box-containing protein